MKIYIVQENFSYMDEDACGNDEYSVNRDIIGISLTVDDAMRTIEEAVKNDCSEYYDPDVYDYLVVVTDTDTCEIGHTFGWDRLLEIKNK